MRSGWILISVCLTFYGTLVAAECLTLAELKTTEGDYVTYLEKALEATVTAGGCLTYGKFPSTEVNSGGLIPTGNIDFYFIDQLPTDVRTLSAEIPVLGSSNPAIQALLKKILNSNQVRLAIVPSLMSQGKVLDKTWDSFTAMAKGVQFGTNLDFKTSAVMLVTPRISDQIFVHEYGHAIDDLSGRMPSMYPLFNEMENDLNSKVGVGYMKSAHLDTMGALSFVVIELPAERFRYAFDIKNNLISSDTVPDFEHFVALGEYPGLKKQIETFNKSVDAHLTNLAPSAEDKIYFRRVCGFVSQAFAGNEYESDYRRIFNPCYSLISK